MKFSTREDIDATVDQVFDSLCDFENFERLAIRRGAKVERTDTMSEPGVGMCWDTQFRMRGRKRALSLVMEEFDRPNKMGLEAKSDSIEASFVVDLIALSRTRTRMSVALELKPKNLSARLLVQSLKLAKATLTKRFKLRVAEHSKLLEERLRKQA